MPARTPSNPLEIWTIFDCPTDYPSRFVVRRFMVAGGKIVADLFPTAVVATLKQARAAVPRRASACLARTPWDEPQIVESWISTRTRTRKEPTRCST